MNPLNMAGPDFLAFYMCLTIVVGGAAAILRHWLESAPASFHDDYRDLDAFAAAYLSGGARRTTEAAVACLFKRQAVHLNGTMLSGIGNPTNLSPQEQAVHEILSERPRTFDQLVQAVRPRYRPLREQLVERGWVLTSLQAFSARVLPTLLFAVVPAVGFAKIAVGVQRDKPVGYLIVFTLLTAAALWYFLRPVHRTHRGQQALDALRKENAAVEYFARQRSAPISPTDIALAVGLFGAVSLTTAQWSDVRTFIRTNERESSANWLANCGAAHSGGSHCGGSSCGGGSGGSGCGGCSS